MKLAPIADRIVRKLADNRGTPQWEEVLWDWVDWESGCALDTKQMDIVFGMVVARWKARAVNRVAEGLDETAGEGEV